MIARFAHCKIAGHSVDRCYKIHDYPPGYKSRAIHQTAAAHQVPISDSNSSSISPPGTTHNNSIANLVDNLTPSEYQELIAIMNTHSSVNLDLHLPRQMTVTLVFVSLHLHSINHLLHILGL